MTGPLAQAHPLLSRLDVMLTEDAMIRAANPAPANYARAVLHVIRQASLGSAAKAPLVFALAWNEEERRRAAAKTALIEVPPGYLRAMIKVPS